MGTCGTPDTINDRQIDVMAKIQAYGKEHGYSQELIMYAWRAAYLESKLGEDTVSETGKYIGLFQYDSVAWEKHSALGDRNDTNAQIIAFFTDMDKFIARWNDPSNNKIPRNSMQLEEYLYIKHHDGPNFDDWYNANGIFIGTPGLAHWHGECFEPNRMPTQPDENNQIDFVDLMPELYTPDFFGTSGSGYNCRPYSYSTMATVNINGHILRIPHYGTGNTCTEDGDSQ